jgi:exopolysaccharide biosynthesis polyprenyl glycosylphosphotransferase
MGEYNSLFLFSNFILLVIFWSLGLYRRKRSLFDSEDFYQLLKSVILCYLITTAATFLSGSMVYSRLIVTNTFVVSLFAITVSRSILNVVLVRARVLGFNRQRAVILGRTEVGESILKKLEEHPELGYDFVGFVELKSSMGEELSKKGVYTVFVALPEVSQEELIELITGCEDVEFKIVPDLMKLISEPLSFDEFRDVPLITVRGKEDALLYSRFFKRLLDLVVSIILLILLSPLFAIAAIGVKLSSLGPVFFRQARVGVGQKLFTVFKFRTMYNDGRMGRETLTDGQRTGGLFKVKDDPRVTRLGRLLRRTCVDELPQLINIILGDMSLVGPRPYTPEEVKFFTGWRRNRFKVKPGLTGLWQISGRYEIEFDKAVLLDIYYIKHMSLWLDLKILLKTIPSIIYSKSYGVIVIRTLSMSKKPSK